MYGTILRIFLFLRAEQNFRQVLNRIVKIERLSLWSLGSVMVGAKVAVLSDASSISTAVVLKNTSGQKRCLNF